MNSLSFSFLRVNKISVLAGFAKSLVLVIVILTLLSACSSQRTGRTASTNGTDEPTTWKEWRERRRRLKAQGITSYDEIRKNETEAAKKEEDSRRKGNAEPKVAYESKGTYKKASITVEKIIASARSYTGTPYQWGGTTRKGIDCSALLLNAYSSVGIDIPRTSSQQCRTGKKVNIEDLRPGDLVFFATGKSRRKVTHAGLVTEVNNKRITFIHASTKAGVVESNLKSNYYMERFVNARRLLK